MLSDIKGGAAVDFLADCVGPIINIALDEEAAALFKREEVPEGEDKARFTLKSVQKSLPALLRGHKEDVMTILAAVNQVPRDEYEERSIVQIAADVAGMLQDEELRAFLS